MCGTYDNQHGRSRGRETAEQLAQATAGLPADKLLLAAANRFPGRIALASSFGAEDQVLTDMLARAGLLEINRDSHHLFSPHRRPENKKINGDSHHLFSSHHRPEIATGGSEINGDCPHLFAPARQTKPVSIFTLDTGRLPQETHDALDATRKRYGITIDVLVPDRAELEAMVREHGSNLFYASIENRKRCCHVRKVAPLRRKLGQLDAWICGLRREQAATRTAIERVEWDEANGLVKLNPLADWTTEQVWDYIRRYDVPSNPLHARGYPSIGCSPCTRAVAPGEDIRAGRWWWETPEQKECGLHVVDGKLVRKKR